MHCNRLPTIIFICLQSLLFSCTGQQAGKDHVAINNDQRVGGPFENSEYMYIAMPEKIAATDTSIGWDQPGQKMLITGTIFKNDGKTPAPGIVLYYYHTNINGLYASREGMDKKVARHGYIRGWVQSDVNGHYAIYTVRPGPYPGRTDPAHIHPAIKEPGINEYYIDEFVFDDDPLLTTAKRQQMQNRGGSGVLRLLQQGTMQVGEHNIILGMNVPGYPATAAAYIQSGKNIGEDVSSFTPYHAWGPDKGKSVCPICKYGRYHGILYFVGNNPDWDDVKKWLRFLEDESVARAQYLKVYFVYGNNNKYDKAESAAMLALLGTELRLTKTALTLVPSFADKASDTYLNRINQEAGNTFILYKNSNVFDKFINLAATTENFTSMSNRLNASRGEFFYLPTIQSH